MDVSSIFGWMTGQAFLLVSAVVSLAYGVSGRFWAGLIVYLAVALSGLFKRAAGMDIVIYLTAPVLLGDLLVLWLIDRNVRMAGTQRQARWTAVVVAPLLLWVAYART